MNPLTLTAIPATGGGYRLRIMRDGPLMDASVVDADPEKAIQLGLKEVEANVSGSINQTERELEWLRWFRVQVRKAMMEREVTR